MIFLSKETTGHVIYRWDIYLLKKTHITSNCDFENYFKSGSSLSLYIGRGVKQ